MSTTRILIVEDEILIARRIETTLIQLGYEVTGIAGDARAALQHVTNLPPDLVLMDIVLPGEQDGVATAREIRDQFQIPVVYLTAYADDHTLERAKLTYPLGYILKPFSQQDLRVGVELALSQHQANVERQNHQMASQLQPEHLSLLSHELRNPLSNIKLSAALLEQRQHNLDDTSRQQYLQHIKSAVDDITWLLEDLLVLERAHLTTSQFNPVNLDVVTFCQEIVEAAQWSAGDQHTITFSCQPTVINARLDRKLLWHLLNNLLSNAKKYSPQGSSIALMLSCEAETLCFTVQDRGIGISNNDQMHLFQPFQRGSNVGKIPGTGLGLAIAKKAVEIHGGDISVESQVGEGTTFVVTLPRGIYESPR